MSAVNECAVTCRVCQGDGWIVVPDPASNPADPTPMQEPCAACSGQGRVLPGAMEGATTR